MKKKIILILLTICACLFAFLGACSKGSDIAVYDATTGELLYDKDHNEITVEYGDIISFRQNITYKGQKATGDMKLFDPDGNELKTVYGSYTFDKRIGEYTVQYFVSGEEDTLDVKIICQDTVAPVIKVTNYTLYGVVGETVAIPRCVFSDLAGIDDASITYTVTAPNGQTNDVTDSFVLEEEGYYVTNVSVKDKHGNESTELLKTQCLSAYIDANRGHAIYTFDNEEYLKLTVNMEGTDNITREIVTSGYPTIADEAQGNGVLKMTSDKVYGDVDTVFLLHEDLMASTGYRIVIRFAVSKDTDYVKVFREKAYYSYKGNEQQIVSQMLGVKANTWYELEINPIDFGYNLNFKDFIIAYRDVGGLEMYIDEIYFVQPEFEDEDWSKTNLADFDEEQYLDHVYQNMYNNPTTTRAFRVGGTAFDILTEGDEEWSAYGLDGAEGGVLYAKTVAKYGGMTYMFPEAIELDEIVAITFRMFNIDKYNGMIFGFFDGNGLDGGNTKWYEYTADEFVFNQWHDITISTSHLSEFTSDGKISGFFLQMTMGTTLNYAYEIEFCIDSITAIYKNDVTEQVDMQIADFEQNSLANVLQYGCANVNRAVGDSVFAIAENEGVNGSKALKITSNESVFGVRYIFDEKVELQDGQSLTLNIAMEQNTTISSITPELRMRSGMSLVGSSVTPSAFRNASYVTVGFSQTELITAGLVSAYELRLKIVASSASANNIVYLDNIRIYDISGDTTAPVITLEDTNGVTLLGNENYQKAKFGYLNYSIIDEDVFAKVSVLSVKDSNGADVDFDEEGFIPTVSGDYQVTVRAEDGAGNVSQSVVATYSITVCADEKEYVKAVYAFNASSSKDLLTFKGSSAQTTFNNTVYSDGKLANVSISTTGTYSALTIDLGGFYKVEDIVNVTVNITVDTPDTNSGWLDAYLNHAGVIDNNARTTRPAVSGSSYKAIQVTSVGKVSYVIEQANILKDTAFTEDTVLDTLTLGFASSGKSVVISIDSIDFVTEEDVLASLHKSLQFNSEDDASLLWKANGTAGIADDGQGNSVAKISYSGYGGANANANSNSNTVRISMGGIYTLGQVSEIKIKIKQDEATGTSTSMNSNIWINRNELTYDTANTNIINSGFVKQFNAGNLSSTEYSTITISYDNISAKYATNGLSDTTLLNTLAFGFTASGGRLAYLHIDSIEIVLK